MTDQPGRIVADWMTYQHIKSNAAQVLGRYEFVAATDPRETSEVGKIVQDGRVIKRVFCREATP